MEVVVEEQNTSTFRYEKKCKVCKISVVDKDLFHQLHVLRFKDDRTLEAIVDFSRTKILEKAYQLAVPNIPNLSNHFSHHIPLDLVAKYKIQVKEKMAVTPVNRNNQVVTEGTTQTLSIYEELENLYYGFKQKVDEFERTWGILTPLSVMPHTMLIRELRACLVDLNKLNSNENLVKAVLQTAFQQYTLGALQGVMKECDQLKTSLKIYIKDQAAVMNLTEQLQQRIYEHISAASKVAIQTVKEQYKIN